MSRTAPYTTLILSLLAGLTLLFLNARDVYAATHTVCASGCDFTTIQAAINASLPGDTIRVNPGTYNENLDLTTMGTGGNLAIVKNGAGTVTVGGTGIKLRNSGAFAFNLTLDGLTFTSTSNNVVIQLNGLAGLTFVNNTINGTGSDFNSHHHLQLTLSSGSGAYTIVNNTFNANGVFGDGLRVSVSGGSPSFTIEGNTFNGGSGPAMTYGIQMITTNSANVKASVTNNSFDDIFSGGIVFDSQNTSSLTSFISGNSLQNFSQAASLGIGNYGGGSAVVHTTIANNTIGSGTEGRGILVEMQGGSTVNGIINGNNVAAGASPGSPIDAIAFAGTNTPTATGTMLIANNTVTAANGAGIYVRALGMNSAAPHPNYFVTLNNNNISGVNTEPHPDRDGIYVAAGETANDANTIVQVNLNNNIVTTGDGITLAQVAATACRTDAGNSPAPTINGTWNLCGSAPATPPTRTPPVAVADTAFANTGTLATINVAANDSNVNALVSVSNPTAQNGATNPSGLNAQYTSAPGFTGTDTFYYTVSSPDGLTDSAVVTVTVTNLEIDVRGNGVSIADGDATPSLSDHTNFGSAALIGGVVTRTFTISNTGAVNLLLTGTPLVSITGPAAGDFSVVVPPTTPIAGGSATTFQVGFDPSAAGIRNATITIANNDSDENPYNFAIQGTGFAANVVINELDSDTPSTDTAEFVELYDGGAGNTALDGLVLVFYNGATDTSYDVFDLDGRTTNASGYFVIGNTGVSPDISFTNNTLQNGADAVALYAGNGADFPIGTTVTTANLQDAFVYDTNQADDPGLLALLNAGQPQVNENSNGIAENQSNQRCPNGSGGQRNTSAYLQAAPTLRAANNCTPTVQFTQATYAANENVGVSNTVVLTRSGNTNSASQVQVSITGGAAISGTDYTGSSFPLIVDFGIGVISQTVPLPIISDTLNENTEDITFQVSSVSNALIGSQNTAALQILDDDPQPNVSLALFGSPLAENGGVATVTASLDAVSGRSVTVNLDYTGTAANISDYIASSAFILIPAGNLTGTVTLTGQDDSLNESNETIIVDITTVTNGTESGSQQVIAAISDDDPLPSLTINDVTVNEAAGTVVFTVTLNTVSGQNLNVDYATANDTATAGSDYSSISTTTLTIPAGSLTNTVTTAITDDSLDENDETLFVNLFNPVNATIGDNQGVGNILDNDNPPNLTINDITIAETAGTATFTITLNTASGRDLSVAYATADDTATAGSDYTGVNTTTLIVPAGSTVATLTMTILDDFVDESNETFFVNLADPINVNISDNQGVGTIIDDDTPGVILTQSGGSTDVAEGGAGDTYTVRLTTIPTASVTVTVNPDAQTDVGNGADNPIILNFAANITALDPQTVTILAVDDAVSEGLHTSTISHNASSADSNYNGGGVPFTPGANLSVNITDNDSPGFTVSPISGNTSETGGLASFTMRLNTQPSANVTVTLVSTDTTEGTASPTSVSFTNLTWNIPQIITVTGVNDDVDDGDQTYIIQTNPAASSDIDYDNVNPADVTVVNIDDDSAGFTVSSISGNTSEDGIIATFTICLTSQPTSSVTIPVISSNTAEGTVAPTSLAFTDLNWNTPQTVTVTGVDDALTDGAVAYTIQTGPATSGDPGYNNLNPDDLSLLNLDNDGVILYLPVIVSGFTPAPDLVVDNLAASSNAASVTIKNNGTAPVVDAFWVDVYLNPTTAPTGVNQRWQDLGSQGLTWGVQGAALPLDPGESLTLTIGDAYYFADLSDFSSPLPIGSIVYAQVDSVNFLTTYGNVQESHEISGGTYNNISSTTSIAGAADAPTVTTGSKASADNGDLPRRD